MKNFFLSIAILLSLSTYAQTLSGVPTFNCIGLYGTGLTDGKVQYREVGSTTWLNGLDIWKDTRAIGGRPANEWRGSVVNLKSGTTYIFQAGGATTQITTWSETFPEAGTTNLSSPTTISTSGTPTGYRVYTGSINGGTNNIVINASYIIIRGMTLTNATNDAIVLGANAHDVVIELNDISGWGQSASTLGGNNQAAVRVQGFSYNAKGVSRIIIQRNKIHNPRYSASAWDAGNTHAYGVNGINFENAGGNHVIRYNTIVGENGKKFMDGIGGADNFTTAGFPNYDSDIYGNIVDGTWDDGIEAEGADCNIRIYGNFLNNNFTGIATATNSVGPAFIWNNVTNVGQRLNTTSTSTLDNEDRGPFNKCGSGDASVRGGRTYLFHNTVLQPKQSGFTNSRGLCGGPVDNGGQLTNAISINNIWTSAYTSKGGLPIAMWQGGSISSTNDLLSPNSTTGSVTKSGTITGNPVYNSSIPLTLDDNGYFLSSGSPGKGKAIAINNFNKGTGVDVGAYNGDKLEFGVDAYKGTPPPPPPVNIPPVANAGADKSITLPTSFVALAGSGTDSDGSIVSYIWTNISGPSGFQIVTQTSPNTTIIGLVQGSYVFRLTVTDDKGATSFDDMTISVNAAPNQPPTIQLISTSADTIVLPINTVNLSSLGADADGTISSYAWSKLSGPAQFTFSNANAQNTTVSNLVQGTYIFRVTVKDNSGASATGDVTVTVKPAVVIPPVKTLIRIDLVYSDSTVVPIKP